MSFSESPSCGVTTWSASSPCRDTWPPISPQAEAEDWKTYADTIRESFQLAEERLRADEKSKDLSNEEFTVRGSDTPQSLAVAADGSAVLLTDVHGKAWRWDGGDVVELSPSQPLTSVTW